MPQHTLLTVADTKKQLHAVLRIASLKFVLTRGFLPVWIPLTTVSKKGYLVHPQNKNTLCLSSPYICHKLNKHLAPHFTLLPEQVGNYIWLSLCYASSWVRQHQRLGGPPTHSNMPSGWSAGHWASQIGLKEKQKRRQPVWAHSSWVSRNFLQSPSPWTYRKRLYRDT